MAQALCRVGSHSDPYLEAGELRGRATETARLAGGWRAESQFQALRSTDILFQPLQSAYYSLLLPPESHLDALLVVVNRIGSAWEAHGSTSGRTAGCNRQSATHHIIFLTHLGIYKLECDKGID